MQIYCNILCFVLKTVVDEWHGSTVILWPHNPSISTYFGQLHILVGEPEALFKKAIILLLTYFSFLKYYIFQPVLEIIFELFS